MPTDISSADLDQTKLPLHTEILEETGDEDLDVTTVTDSDSGGGLNTGFLKSGTELDVTTISDSAMEKHDDSGNSKLISIVSLLASCLLQIYVLANMLNRRDAVQLSQIISFRFFPAPK